MRFTPEEEERLLKKLHLELGSTVRAALVDDQVVEICVNDDGFVRVERLGKGFEVTRERFTPQRVVGLLKTIATLRDQSIGRSNPVLESWIPGSGARIEGVLSSISRHPVFSIRRHSRVIYTLSDFVAQGRMSEAARDALRVAVTERLNVLVAGGTGTGKTSLVNALLREMEEQKPEVRCGILEKTREIQSTSPNHFQLETDSYGTDLERLLSVSLRMRPDRIVVGEVRGPEALTLIRAWNTGHPGGVSTLHANSATGALRRLEQLASHGASERTLRGEIGETVGVVAYLERDENGPYVRSVLRVHEHDGDRYVVEDMSREDALLTPKERAA